MSSSTPTPSETVIPLSSHTPPWNSGVNDGSGRVSGVLGLFLSFCSVLLVLVGCGVHILRRRSSLAVADSVGLGVSGNKPIPGFWDTGIGESKKKLESWKALQPLAVTLTFPSSPQPQWSPNSTHLPSIARTRPPLLLSLFSEGHHRATEAQAPESAQIAVIVLMPNPHSNDEKLDLEGLPECQIGMTEVPWKVDELPNEID